MVTVPDKLRHKHTSRVHTETNLALNDCLDPHIVFMFSACIRYATWLLLSLFFCICDGYKFDHGNPIEINKYRNQWDESNYNSNNYNIYHLFFEILYHYSEKLPSAGIKEVYQITKPDKTICTFLWIDSNLMRRYMKETQHKQLISNWYKYWWENITKRILIVIKGIYPVQ